MEFENTGTQPIPDYTLLKMEVKQQSMSCDIKVKSGTWEKLYHSCVLAKSPFFEHMMCSKFRESSTGTVELSVGTPATIDQTLMFLYGEEPKLTLKNIESFVELAEFLMLKNLKSFCMKWLRGVSVERLTDDLCMSLLQLSTVYNITVPSLTRYIDAHLMSLIHNPKLISLDKSSVEHILFEKRLGYVPVDEKLKYFERWCQCHMDTISLQWVKEIVQKFNLHDVSKNILEDLVQRHPFDGLGCLKDALMNYSDSGSNMHKVLLIPDMGVKNCFLGLDLQQKHWYRIDLSYLTGKYMSTIVWSLEKAGLSTSSEMYFVNFRKIRDGGKRSSISCLNFVTGESNMYRVVLEFKPPCCDIKHFTMAGDLCFACININDDSQSVVYAGHVGRKSIHLSQLFSLRIGKIFKMCVNDHSVLAIIPKSKKCVLLYDFKESSLTEIPLEFPWAYRIFPSSTGFILNNRVNMCFVISRSSGSCFSYKYLSERGISANDQRFKRNICAEYCIICSDDSIHQSDRFIKIATVHDLFYSDNLDKWTRYPFPGDTNPPCNSNYNSGSLVRTALTEGEMIIVDIPRTRLRCELNCPHCKAIHPDLDYSDLSDSDLLSNDKSSDSNSNNSCTSETSETSDAFVSSEDDEYSSDNSYPFMFYGEESSSDYD